MNDGLREAINTIPGDDGWWKSSSHESYTEIAERLEKFGVPEEDIFDILESAYWAAASCFGM